MVYGLWLSAAGLQANQYHQDLLANNLANVDTAGFKRDLAVFAERQIAAREGLLVGDVRPPVGEGRRPDAVQNDRFHSAGPLRRRPPGAR